MKKKINWWAIIAVLVIGVPVGYVGMGLLKKLVQNPKPEPVIEDAPYLSINKTDFTLKSKNDTVTFEIDSNTAWEVSTGDESDWLTIEPSKGNGTTVVTLTAKDNQGDERKAKLKVSWTDKDDSEQTETLSVTQSEGGKEQKLIDMPEPPIPVKLDLFANVNKSRVLFTASGGSQSITISSNTEWALTVKGGDWLTTDVTEGKGNKSIKLNALSIASTADRTATIVLTWNDDNGKSQTKSVSITQKGATPQPTPFLNVSSGRASFKSSGGSSTVNIKSNTDWDVTVSGGGDWLTVSPKQGKGNKSIVLKANTNASTADRSATVKISWKDDSGAAQSSTVSVSQTGATLKKLVLSVAQQKLSYDAAGGTKSLAVKSNTDWKVNVSATDGWLSVVGGQGNGNGNVKVKVEKNTGTSNRNAKLTVSWTDEKGEAQSSVVSVGQKPASKPPIPGPTKEELQPIVASGQKSSKVPDGCSVVVNGHNTTDYQAFRMGVNYKAYTNVKVTSVSSDANGKVTKITVTATESKETE